VIPQNMPWSKEIELAILSLCAVGTNQEAVQEICSLVKPEHFYSDKHKLIFEAIRSMVEEGTVIDMPKLCERITASGLMEKCGGPVFMESLTDFGNCSADYHGDCCILKRYAMLRGMIKAGMAIIARASLATDDPADIAEGTIKFLRELESDLLSDHSTAAERDNAIEMAASLESQSRAVVVTGIEKLDAELGGFRSGELVIIGAETGVGKTVFARQIRRAACKRGIHGLYCSGEMDGEQLSAREAASRTGIPLRKFRNPWEMEKTDFNLVLDFAAGECDKCSVLSGNLSVSRVTSAAMEIRRRKNLGFMMVDYDELVDAPGKTEFEKQNTVARACKSVAMGNHIPVFLLSQVRKLQQGERADKPSRHRLFGGSAKANDASTILFIDRPFVRDLEGDQTQAKIYILKNRNGSIGHIDCLFNISTMRFAAIETTQIP